jgi:hypothetical protein
MAKSSGLGSSLIVGAYDVSGDIGALSQIEAMRADQDVSGIDKSAAERISLLKDGSLAFTSFWNTAAGQAHLALSPQPRTDVQVSYLHTSAVGGAAASMIAKQVSYAPTRGQDGSLVVENSAHANGYGLEWGELLTTGKQTFASGTLNGTSIDYGSVSTLFGATAYLHTISLGSGTPTVTVTDSANDSTFATLAPTALVFTPTVAGTSRLQTGVTATIRRYTRVEVTGTYTNLVAVLVFVRYLEAS